MKKNLSLWQLVGFSAVSLLGTLLHFLYDLTENSFTALFSAVNESTWEHMKLLFFPLFLFAIMESFFLRKEHKNFWCIKIKGTILGLILIPVIFYTLQGIFGKTPDWINISIFFVCAGITFLFETQAFLKEPQGKCFPFLALFLFILIAIAFWAFTFFPPQIPLFQDPITQGYGIV